MRVVAARGGSADRVLGVDRSGSAPAFKIRGAEGGQRFEASSERTRERKLKEEQQDRSRTITHFSG